MHDESRGKEPPEQDPSPNMSRYEKITEQIAQLQKEKQGIENRRRAEEHRAKTRRLMEIGALTLQHFNVSPDIEPKAFATLLAQLVPPADSGIIEPPPAKT